MKNKQRELVADIVRKWTVLGGREGETTEENHLQFVQTEFTNEFLRETAYEVKVEVTSTQYMI